MYLKFSDKLFQKYNKKVYKLPISIDCTCPNRDGYKSDKGCIFCSEVGAGYENSKSNVNLINQIDDNKGIFERKYKAEAFILYFQNFTNTYLPLIDFKNNIENCLNYLKNTVAVSISTRPDCIDEDYLKVLNEIKEKYNIDITIELGLQSVNNNTLKILNRKHTLSDYINAALMIKKYNFEVSTHVILSLPWDDREDVIECAKILSILNTDYVKIHSLYIEENTILAKMYKEKKVKMLTLDEFIDRVVLFLEYLDKNIAIERLVSRVPKERELLFLNWDRSHWIIQDMILDKMKEKNTFQGKQYSIYQKGILEKFK